MDKFIVKEKDELYNYLRNNLNKSKNNIKSLLKNECIYVNNNVITKYNYVVNSGDIISIGKAITYKDVNLKIIYEDSDIIVIDKPTKILTISNSKEKEKTLYREVSNYLKMENKKVFVIHRLDYDTSGVIMFAKNQKIQKLYQDNWNNLAKKKNDPLGRLALHANRLEIINPISNKLMIFTSEIPKEFYDIVK